jgi:hypothetical protein
MDKKLDFLELSQLQKPLSNAVLSKQISIDTYKTENNKLKTLATSEVNLQQIDTFIKRTISFVGKIAITDKDKLTDFMAIYNNLLSQFSKI